MLRCVGQGSFLVVFCCVCHLGFSGQVERYTGNFFPVRPEFKALNPVFFNFCYCLMKVNSFDEVGFSSRPANATNVTRRVDFFNLTQFNVDQAKVGFFFLCALS